jgi:hypothetical protein
MKADTLTLKDIFQQDVHYVIPIFQRPYVWTQEDQWEALWNDLRNAAEWYLEDLSAADGNRVIAQEKAKRHFLGAVVLQQQATQTAEISVRTVIDGQQRLTTMQLLLDAAQEVLEEMKFEEAARLERLVLNHYATGDKIFKLWPTSLDQDAFRAAMTNSAVTPEGFEGSRIVQAHDFFRLQIREWIDTATSEEDRTDRVHGLETALFGLLVMVVIDLASADDPFVIFETLNARGTPLLASDLIKNYVLQTATGQALDADNLYRREWKPFEDSWWRKEIQQGRISRPRLDVFLNYWLIMKKASEVPANDVFTFFKGFVEENNRGIDEVAQEVRVAGATYKGLEDIEPTSRSGTFLYRWRTVEAGVSTPVLLWLFSQPPDSLPPDRLERALCALESFLVRRMLCRMTTRGYYDLFLDVLGRIKAAAPGAADEALVQYLVEQTSESAMWPDDFAFESSILDTPLYRLLTRGRLRMVLEALEDDMRSALAEEQNVQRGCLTIEHVLPQKWREHWPTPDGDDELEAMMRRERALHSLGNLTLVNGKLNPAMSNGTWETKRQLLSEHTVLHLNKELLNTYGNRDWNDAAIRERGKKLAARVIAIWPGPEAWGVPASNREPESPPSNVRTKDAMKARPASSNLEVADRGIAAVTDHLTRRGAEVDPASEEGARNVISVVAPSGRRSVAYIKTKTNGDWQTDIRKGTPREPVVDEHRFWILVDLEKPSAPEFCVVPEWWIENDIYHRHQEWVAKHGGVRPRNPGSTHHSVQPWRVEEWRDRWDLLEL